MIIFMTLIMILTRNNLVRSKKHKKILTEMRALLSEEMIKAKEKRPVFHKALIAKKI